MRGARLVLLRGEQAGRKFAVDGTVILGRAHDVQIQIDDPEISRRHARIERLDPEHFVLEDLGSRNGTHLNGAKIRRETLSFGDRIELGRAVELLFLESDPAEDSSLRQQRLQVLGQLAAGVAHDINSMLSAVNANIEWLRGLPGETTLAEGEVRESIEDVLAATARATDLIRSLLSFARGTGRGPTRVDLSALCAEVGRVLRRSLPRNIQLEVRVEEDLAVFGDRLELHQVLVNLCLNARDAMPDGGLLRVEAALCPREAREALPLVEPGPHVAIVVKDTGIGIDDGIRQRIFEPFFSTKEEGRGSGLGLATVWEVIRCHSGHVSVDSSPNQGTTFTVYLPTRLTRLRDRWAARTAEGGSPPLAPPPGATILLVDDEAVVQRSMGRLLRRAGFTVQYAASGIEALEVFARAIPKPDLVMLDLDLPGLGGEDTLARILEMDPRARVLVMSGDQERSLGLSGAVGTLDKPSDGRVLIETVARALLSQVDQTQPT